MGGEWWWALNPGSCMYWETALPWSCISSDLFLFSFLFSDKVSLHHLSRPRTCSVAPASLDFTILLLWSPDQLDLQDILLALPDYMFLWRLGRESFLLVQALKLLAIPYVEEYWCCGFCSHSGLPHSMLRRSWNTSQLCPPLVLLFIFVGMYLASPQTDLTSSWNMQGRSIHIDTHTYTLRVVYTCRLEQRPITTLK